MDIFQIAALAPRAVCLFVSFLFNRGKAAVRQGTQFLVPTQRADQPQPLPFICKLPAWLPRLKLPGASELRIPLPKPMHGEAKAKFSKKQRPGFPAPPGAVVRCDRILFESGAVGHDGASAL